MMWEDFIIFGLGIFAGVPLGLVSAKRKDQVKIGEHVIPEPKTISKPKSNPFNDHIKTEFDLAMISFDSSINEYKKELGF